MHFGVWSYANPTVFGIPLWFRVAFGTSSGPLQGATAIRCLQTYISPRIGGAGARQKSSKNGDVGPSINIPNRSLSARGKMVSTSSAYHAAQERAFRSLSGSGAGRTGRAVDWFLIVLICLNVLAVILETDRAIRAHNTFLFYSFLLFSTIAFTVEYALRLWTCTLDERFMDPIRGRIRYALTPLAIIDLITVVPFYLTLFVEDQPVIRALRLLVILRIFKLSRYHASFDILKSVLYKRRWELFATGVIGATILIIASALMWLVEGPAQPEKFGSIPDAMWWAAVTLTTVGYGDVWPITPLGKVLGSLIAFLGIGLFALPTGILGSAFYEEFQHRKGQERDTPHTCPHCGKEIKK
ncbi:MAG: ion transporter [Halobacteriota archaeon]